MGIVFFEGAGVQNWRVRLEVGYIGSIAILMRAFVDAPHLLCPMVSVYIGLFCYMQMLHSPAVPIPACERVFLYIDILYF